MRLINVKRMTQKRLFLSLLCLLILAACSGTPAPTVTPIVTNASTAVPTLTLTAFATETIQAIAGASSTEGAFSISTPEATVTAAATALASSASASSLDSAPAVAVNNYLSAMVADNVSKMPQLICPAYEAGAKTDFDSFGAIGGVKLNNVSCTTTSINGDNATVVCKGSIEYTYNGEANSQDLSGNTYSAQQVDGAWTMCGYK